MLLNRNNNFDFLRVFAAGMVVFAHSFDLLGLSSHEPLRVLSGNFIDFGALAVNMFFVISGFLITASLFSGKGLLAFLIARVLRIYPALVVAVLFSSLVIGAWFTQYEWLDYIRHQQLSHYIFSNLFFFDKQYILLDLFSQNPMTELNGSLWTIRWECFFYGALLILGLASIDRPAIAKCLCWFFYILMIALCWSRADLTGLKPEPINFMRVAPYFAVGGLLYLHYPLTARLIKHGIIILLVLSAFVFMAKGSILFKPMFTLTLALAVLWLAYSARIKLPKSANGNDYSYGVYLFACPIQQSLVASFTWDFTYAPLVFFICSMCCVLPFALLSWHYIEKPALNLRKPALAWLNVKHRVYS